MGVVRPYRYMASRHPVHGLHHPKVICDDVLHRLVHEDKIHVLRPKGRQRRHEKEYCACVFTCGVAYIA